MSLLKKILKNRAEYTKYEGKHKEKDLNNERIPWFDEINKGEIASI